MPDDEQRTVAVLKVGRKHVAGVFTTEGLYATSIPRDTLREALNAVKGTGLKRDDHEEYRSVLETVFTMMEGSSVDIEDIRFDFSDLTTKQLKVINALLRVTLGETVTYGELARRAGVPGAARFVGNVMATNRFAPLVPCHRVVSSSGLGGYGFGLEKKQELLRAENAI